MLMISDQMPTTSDFVPLIQWFYLSIIIIISIGTFLTSVILSIQGEKIHSILSHLILGRRQYGKIPPLLVRYWFFFRATHWLWLSVPPPLSALWDEMDVSLFKIILKMS
jgi:nicotinic acetylcholine receptor